MLKLSREHVPADEEERRRIERAGGMVAAFPDEPPPEVREEGEGEGRGANEKSCLGSEEEVVDAVGRW